MSFFDIWNQKSAHLPAIRSCPAWNVAVSHISNGVRCMAFYLGSQALRGPERGRGGVLYIHERNHHTYPTMFSMDRSHKDCRYA